MAGLFAARALAGHYRRVTIVERDRLGPDTGARRGVPQGSHVHGLLLRGVEVLEDLCPGIFDELLGNGSTQVSYPADFRIEFLGHRLCSPPAGHRFVLASRPFLEAHLRRQVLDTPGIVLRDGHEVTGILSAPDGRVTGVRITPPGSRDGEEAVEGGLVVDALGRAGRGRAWLDALGCPRPPEQRLNVGIRYASRHFRLPPDACGGLSVKAIVIAPRPGRRRGMVLCAQEDRTWVLSLTGYDESPPPTSPDAFLDWVRDLASEEIYALVRDAEPLDGIALYRFPVGHRQRYERLRRHPQGLISTGDSLCCLNPFYGTGITVAAELALLLRDCLAHGGQTDLPHRFYAGAARITRVPWLMSRLAERTLIPPRGPAPVSRLTSAGMRRLVTAASRDPAVATAFYETLGMSASPLALVRPRLLARTWYFSRPPRAVPPGDTATSGSPTRSSPGA